MRAMQQAAWGESEPLMLELPLINGWDVAGVVEETGYGTFDVHQMCGQLGRSTDAAAATSAAQRKAA